jgi:transcriptional regulator with XRE-family HTH domain
MEIRKQFGRELQAAREEAGLSQAEVAERTGQAQTNISAIERGERNLTISTMTKLARAVGATLRVRLFARH